MHPSNRLAQVLTVRTTALLEKQNERFTRAGTNDE
jgi:hypothetical protein